jgi:UDP-glucuronate decarboxylase
MKTCLVTGSAGFVGSHLCDRLLKDGYKVIGVDNLYTGSLKNLAECVVHRQFTFHHLDVSDEKFFQTFRLFELDYIFNLACPASPVHYQRDPVYTFMTNILGAKNVLDLARLTRARVVQASTSEIYGDPLIHPQPESYYGNVNTLGPRACYDEGKRGAETLFSDYRRKYEVNTGIFRIFNTYGPRMAKDDGRVVSNFIVSALADADLTIHGMGAQTRSFQYIDDLIEGIVRFAFSSETGPINLGNPGEFTVDELASIVIQKLNKGYKVYVERTIDDPQQRKPDITLAKDKLNWEPKIALSEGLDKTIEYFRSV